MICRHLFQVSAYLKRVTEFHSPSTSMAAITSPPIIVQVHTASPLLADGDEMDFTMWIGLLPIHCLARIEEGSTTGFSDRQLRSPFTEWVYRHLFRAFDEKTSDVMDEISFRLRSHPLWWPIGLGIWLGLPVFSIFRAWKTKRMLS